VIRSVGSQKDQKKALDKISRPGVLGGYLLENDSFFAGLTH
jgi:hypothetical protein